MLNRRMTQAALAEATGLSQSSVSRVLKAQRMLTFEEGMAVAKVLGVDWPWLLGAEVDPEQAGIEGVAKNWSDTLDQLTKSGVKWARPKRLAAKRGRREVSDLNELDLRNLIALLRQQADLLEGACERVFGSSRQSGGTHATADHAPEPDHGPVDT